MKNSKNIIFKYRISLLIFGLLLVSCEQENSQPFEGTYELLVNSESNNSEVQLLACLDGQRYGIMEWHRQKDTIKSAISVRGQNDSLILEFNFRNISFKLQKNKEGYAGNVIEDGKSTPVILNWRSKDINQDLEASQSLELINLDAEEPAYISFKNNGDVYYVDWRQKQIYFASISDKGYSSEALSYDSKRYNFSSVGYSDETNELIAHGKDMSLENQEGGSIYKLILKDNTTVDSIIKYPESINTPTYDNFPDFTDDGRIIFSSWGKPAGAPNYGEGDIFISELNEDGSYTTNNISNNINTTAPDAGSSLAFGDKLIIFHRGVNELGAFSDKLFYSTYKDGQWAKAKRFEAPVNILYSYQYAPRIGPEGEFIYFTSGHQGQGKIYRYPIKKLNLKL